MADLSGSHSRFDSLVQDVRSIILIKRSEAERSVDFHRVATYWKVGQRIVEEEQGGQDRAPYGARFINRLAARIELKGVIQCLR